jgi:hypothetical protein
MARAMRPRMLPAMGWALTLAGVLDLAPAGAVLAQAPAVEGGAPSKPAILPIVPGAPLPGAPPTGVAQPWQPRNAAELQALDRIDDRSATLNVPVGQTIQFEHINITVRACVVRPPDQAADAAAFLQIVDSRASAPAFSGWMLVAEPFVSMLQHPTFDVRVLACH